MRFKFESAGKEPIGEGRQRKAFVDPGNEKRVIVETKEGKVDTHRQLKGRYYLTKIIHLLLPQHIPDVHQVGESVDGKQTVDRAFVDRVSDTNEDIEGELQELVMKLSDLGLGFNIEENASNFAKDKDGNVKYFESFTPWQEGLVSNKEIELLFDEEDLREAIEKLSDPEVRERCLSYLRRLMALVEEERQEIQAVPEMEKKDSVPLIQDLENFMSPFLQEEFLQNLHAITTEEVALKSLDRKTSHQACIEILARLKVLKEETDITDEEYIRLFGKYRLLSRARGAITKDGVVDHDR